VSYNYERFPPREVATIISKSARKLDNLLKDSPFYRDYEQQLLGFFDDRPEGLLGSYVNYHLMIRSGTDKKLGVVRYLTALSEEEQALVRKYFGHSFDMVPVFKISSERIKNARAIFPNDNMGFIGIGASQSAPIHTYDVVLNHEVGHMISSRLERDSLLDYLEFGRHVYAPYIKRVLPEVSSAVSLLFRRTIL